MTSRCFPVGRRRGLLLAAFASLVACAAPAAWAQQACASSSPAARAWPAPLDRRIAVHARNVTLREGLDRVAVPAGFRLSYSAELLPLDRRVCLSSDSVIAGDALAELLAGTGVEAVVTGIDQVALTPGRAQSRQADAMAAEAQTLDRVVVTGSATGDAQRPLSVALDVLEGKTLAARRSSSLASTFDGSIPGMWVWEQSPSSLLARYGSIRGASSFGVSYPKVYIDGIEVANPLLLTDLNPSALDHVEVIRGPQGAALYGADAISGVINIVTRHEGTQAGGERTEVTSGAGLSQTSYAARSVFAQDHTLTWREGSSMRSESVGLSVASLGGYVPQAYSRDVKMNAAFRAVTSRASFTGTGRFYGKTAAVGENPLLTGFTQAVASRASTGTRRHSFTATTVDSAAVTRPDSLPESIREYTLGGAATLFTSGRWTPSFVAGVDGYRLANVPNDLAPVSSATDTALHAARGGADRGTLKASLVGEFPMANRRALTVTLAAENSSLRETQNGVLATGATGVPLPGNIVLPTQIIWRTNTGLIAQGNASIHDAVYLTAGVRLERNDGFTASARTALLPMIGASAVRDVGTMTIKVRGAYGRGIRPVQTTVHTIALRDIRRNGTGPDLDPEEQAGTEFGADLLFGRFLGLHITRFDQRAFGLIQPVAIPRDSLDQGRGGSGGAGGGGAGKPRLAYVLQNVGEITNRGWELESSVNVGAFSVGGALSTVDSRVQHIAHGYTGDLMTGDRMLGVPGTTLSGSASWNQPHWFATVTASRASDWTNYDRLRLAMDFSSTNYSAQDLTGNRLRSYWMTYNGVTRVRATMSRDLVSGISLKLTGDNLTNAQRGEPDNITVLPGRTLLIGLSAKLR